MEDASQDRQAGDRPARPATGAARRSIAQPCRGRSLAARAPARGALTPAACNSSRRWNVSELEEVAMDGADPTFEEYVRARWTSLVCGTAPPAGPRPCCLVARRIRCRRRLSR